MSLSLASRLAPEIGSAVFSIVVKASLPAVGGSLTGVTLIVTVAEAVSPASSATV